MITLLFGVPAVLTKGKYTQEARIYAVASTLFIDYLILFYGK